MAPPKRIRSSEFGASCKQSVEGSRIQERTWRGGGRPAAGLVIKFEEILSERPKLTTIYLLSIDFAGGRGGQLGRNKQFGNSRAVRHILSIAREMKPAIVSVESSPKAAGRKRVPNPDQDLAFASTSILTTTQSMLSKQMDGRNGRRLLCGKQQSQGRQRRRT